MMAVDYQKRGLVFNIQKFSIHDGSGMRTLVFMKGCPLSCLWCSNPESQSRELQIMDVRKNCISCGACYAVCPSRAISEKDFEIDRALCSRCGACTQKCYAGAKKSVGQWYSVGEIMETIEKDAIFYRNSGGGVTVGGGEPAMQSEFTAELFKACHAVNIHTAVETCGYSPWSSIKRIFEQADQVFFDLKHMDSGQHKKLTGVDNGRILQNAQKLAQMEKEIIFRLPLIPGQNDSLENVRRTGEFAASLMQGQSHVSIEILPYHNLGQDKYQWLSEEYTLGDIRAPEEEYVENCRRLLKGLGCKVIEGSK